MSREVSVHDLRNHTGDVVAAVRAGERVSLTVNRLPVADIVPHATAAKLELGVLRARNHD